MTPCSWQLSATIWHLLFQDLILIIMRASSSVTEFPTISPGLQKKTTPELVTDAGVPLNSTFLIVLINERTSGPFCLTQCIHSSTHTSLKFLIPSSPCLPWKFCYTSFNWAKLSGSGIFQLCISTGSPNPCQSVKSFIIGECLHINIFPSLNFMFLFPWPRTLKIQAYVSSLSSSGFILARFCSNFGRPSTSLAQLGCVLTLAIGLVIRAGEEGAWCPAR